MEILKIICGAAGFAVPFTLGQLFHKKIQADKERKRFEEVQDNLENITEEGMDEYTWTLPTDVSPLPKHDGYSWLHMMGYKRYLRGPKESNGDYLERVFRSFSLYKRDDGRLVAKRGSLSLFFDLKEQPIRTELREETLFEPKVLTGYEPIIATLPVRIHQSMVHYRIYSMQEGSHKKKEISRPSLINYV